MVSTFELADNVVGIIIDSDLDQELIERVQAKIRDKIDDYGEINIFFEIKRGTKFGFKAFLDQMTFNLNHTRSFRKIAVVSDLDWLRTSMFIKDIIVETNIRSFSNNERLEALAWIAE
ncbi:STAS/SEC14 domain-containing protein [Salinimicrobium marinum]|uniref:STAS/SEC14 domain-containing protein n=1 Tax=Salinimicrobium marinum TaxID=680283 RepID=A0A918S4Z8_9FLAO|nr:STAS/SEC14 domain-containing protein [Salinimicrobium marinum]GHA24773.1 STAS/SEC14 domain-containing protein [Salinimicrobium marinum]